MGDLDYDDDYAYEDEEDFNEDQFYQEEEEKEEEEEEKEPGEQANPDLIPDELETVIEENMITSKVLKVRKPHNTFPFLTQFEITRCLENRAKEIEAGKPLTVPLIIGERPWRTALRELREGCYPLVIDRIDQSRGIRIPINPNSINEATGQPWLNEEAVNFFLHDEAYM